MSIAEFEAGLVGPNLIERLAGEVIGRAITVEGAAMPLLYADWTASGRALKSVERFMQDSVLPLYANTHTEHSVTGRATTRLRRQAREFIAREIGAGPDHAVIFAGAGATGAINKLVSLLAVSEAAARGEAVVFHGPYEHHSNILPWRESGAQVVEIGEAAEGGPDLAALEAALRAHAGKALKIGTFAAGSNVTGILTDVVAVTQLLKAHGALSVWDYAAAGPYCPIAINQPGAEIDAIVLSPHKFAGGPGASGVLALRREIATPKTPSQPGGGTVIFVSPWEHRYTESLVEREEAGTPNILGDIRAALAFAVKAAVGTETIAARDAALVAQARAAWEGLPGLEILGHAGARRLPIFSLMFRGAAGEALAPAAVTEALSARWGIQARGGCACAGPYGHRLLGIDQPASKTIATRILAGDSAARPGWVRLNLSWLNDAEETARIIDAVCVLAREVAAGTDLGSAA